MVSEMVKTQIHSLDLILKFSIEVLETFWNKALVTSSAMTFFAFTFVTFGRHNTFFANTVLTKTADVKTMKIIQFGFAQGTYNIIRTRWPFQTIVHFKLLFLQYLEIIFSLSTDVKFL